MNTLNDFFDEPDEEKYDLVEYSPGYWVSRCGKLFSEWSSGSKSKRTGVLTEMSNKSKPDNRKGYTGGYQENSLNPFIDDAGKHIQYIVDAKIKEGTGFQYTLDPRRIRLSIKRHRAVMDCFKPLDEYSHEIGISKDDWNNTPESSKLFIRRQVYVNHKDHDRLNNHIDNLEWTDVMDNANKKINDRVKNGDVALNKEHKGIHDSKMTNKQLIAVGQKKSNGAWK